MIHYTNGKKDHNLKATTFEEIAKAILDELYGKVEKDNRRQFVIGEYKNSYWNLENFIQSEYIVLDVDHCGNERAIEIRNDYSKKKDTFLTSVSTSKDGVKIILKLSEPVKDFETLKAVHNFYATEIEKQYKVKVDRMPFSIVSSYFLADKEAFFNPNCVAVKPYRYEITKADKKLQQKETSDEIDEIELNGASEGSRHTSLIKLVGRHIGRRTDIRTAKTLLLLWNEKNRPPLPEKEVLETIESSYKKWFDESQNKLQLIPETPQSFADILAAKFKEQIKYNHTSRKWFIYNGKQWQEDNKKEIYKFIRDILFQINGYLATADLTPDDLKKYGKIVKWYENPETKDAILKECSSLPEISTESREYDNQDNLLNLSNGTIEFNETGYKLLGHNPKDLLTKIADVEYIENATCPNWEKFLNVIFNNDSDLIRYVQKSLGYSLSTSTDENCFFFMYGTGKNGKSTFTDIIENLLGDYYIKASSSVIMQKRSEATNDIAGLKGSRFVSCSEIGEGKALNEEQIKDLTGGDTVSARYLYQEAFQFKPKFKLWIYGNHKPRITGTDEGIRRRVKLIPFENTIPDEIKKPKEIIMAEMKAEFSGILNWILEGYKLWRSEGLQNCAKVTLATNEYFSEFDTIENFLTDCCEITSEGFSKSSDLYKCFLSYCNESGERSFSQKDFGQKLISKGYEKEKKRNGIYYRNIEVKQEYYEQNTGVIQMLN
ncbi:MAG: hypothetical protein GXX85_17745 [Ignavibacteria bacterium]|nr:hypothetical protein [Ignavibacteria bacterium]